MKLSDRQAAFTIDVGLLIHFVNTKYPEIKICLREAQRTREQQQLYKKRGLSKTEDSKHIDCLGVDFAFYVQGNYMGDWLKEDSKAFLQPIGNYFEALTPGNRWGGNWSDPYDPWHFEAA